MSFHKSHFEQTKMTPRDINRKLGKILNLLLDAKDVKTPPQQNFLRLAKADIIGLRTEIKQQFYP